METGIHNTSEIGRLRKVLLHRPGQELENLMPEYLERLLFDDIPYLKEAQAEHDAFAQCLRDAGVEVVYLTDLVVESLTGPEVRQALLMQFLDEAGVKEQGEREAVEAYLSELDDRTMVSAMMAGVRASAPAATGRKAQRPSLRGWGRTIPLPWTPCRTSILQETPLPPSAPACPFTKCIP